MVCFIFWLVWRAFKKQKQKKLQQGGDITPTSHGGPFTTTSGLPGRLYNRVVGKIPFASRQRKAWQTLEEKSSPNAGPMMAGEAINSQMNRASGATFNEKARNTFQSLGFESDLSPAFPAQVYYPGDFGAGLRHPPELQRAEVSNANMAPAPVASAYMPSPAASFDSSQIPAQPIMPTAVLSIFGASSIMAGNTKPPASADQQQYETDDVNMSNETLRSRMPDSFYNQSQLARQPSDAYDPMRRQVNRISELSSLSSGFGDGDIPVLPSNQRPRQSGQAFLTIPEAPATPTGLHPATSPTSAGRFSWLRKQRISRETVYTEASEDRPARFRSVNSWVRQQTGRVRRGQASIDTTTSASAGGADGVAGGNVVMMPGDEPGIPHPLPEEQRLTMMMDDEEIPRHPDTVPGIRMA